MDRKLQKEGGVRVVTQENLNYVTGHSNWTSIV